MRGFTFLGSKNTTILFAVAILAIAFIVWTQNVVDDSLLILLAAAALLVVAFAGQVQGSVEEVHEARESEPEGFHEHPESFEEEAHGSPAGH